MNLLEQFGGVAPPYTPRLQVQQVTDTINRTLEAQATQIVGVMAVIVGLAVLALLIYMMNESRQRAARDNQQFALLKAQIENNKTANDGIANIHKELAKQTPLLTQFTDAQENILEFQSQIVGTTQLNLELTRERAAIHDVNSQNIRAILAAQQADKTELMTLMNALSTDVNTVINRAPIFTQADKERIESKLDLIIARLQLKPETVIEEPKPQTLAPGDAQP